MAKFPTPDEVEQLLKVGQLTPDTASKLNAQTQPAPQSQPEAADPATASTNVWDAASERLNGLRKYLGPGWQRNEQDKQASLFPIGTEPGTNSMYDFERNRTPAATDPTQSTPGTEAPAQPTEFLPTPQSPTQTNPIDDKYLKGMERGFNMQEQAAKTGGQEGARLANEVAATLEQHNQNMQKLEADRVQKEQARQAQFEKEVSDYEDLSNKLLNSKVDPERWYNSRSTGQKIMAGIGVMLGGIGSGITGGPNKALDIINGAIDRDIDAQKSDLDKIKSVGGMKQNILNMMREKFGDERQAEAATRAFFLDQTIRKTQALAAQQQGAGIKEQADRLVGQLEVQKNGLLQQFHQASMAKQIMLGGGQQLPQGVDIEQLSEDQRARYVPGIGLASTKEGAKDMRDFKAVADDVNGGVQELLSFTEKSGDSINPADRARAKTLASMLKGQLRLPIVGPGAVSESEWKLLEDIVANPTKIFSLDPVSRASLETVNRRIQAQLANKAKANGLRPIGQQVQSFQPRK